MPGGPSRPFSSTQSSDCCSIGDSPGRAHRLKTQRLAVVGLDSDVERVVSPGTGETVRLLDVESGYLIVQLGEATTAVLKMGILKGGA